MQHYIFGDSIYPSAMPRPSGKLMAREKINLWIMLSEVRHLWTCNKFISKIGVQTHCLPAEKKENNFQHNRVVSSTATDLENKIT